MPKQPERIRPVPECEKEDQDLFSRKSDDLRPMFEAPVGALMLGAGLGIGIGAMDVISDAAISESSL